MLLLAKKKRGTGYAIHFGSSENIRALCALIHFDDVNIFHSVLMPGGASCASFITYASGMAEKAPRNSAFVGPVDPTGNDWFPADHLSLSIPLHMAIRMVENIDDSFLVRRPGIVFPEKRRSASLQ